MYLRALMGLEKAWGAEHKRSLDTRFNMAILYRKENRLQDARAQLELAVQGYTKVLGPDHRKTIKASEVLKQCKAN